MRPDAWTGSGGETLAPHPVQNTASSGSGAPQLLQERAAAAGGADTGAIVLAGGAMTGSGSGVGI